MDKEYKIHINLTEELHKLLRITTAKEYTSIQNWVFNLIKIALTDEAQISQLTSNDKNNSLLNLNCRILDEFRIKCDNLIENIKDGVAIINKEGITVFINDKLCEIFGYKKEELIGRDNIDLIFNTDNIDILKEKLVNASFQDVKSFDLSIKSKSGGTVYVIASPELLYNASGEYIGFLTIFTDITNRKQIEQRLKESEEKYRLLFNSDRDAILLIDKETNLILDANKAAENLYGYTKDEFVKLKINDLYELIAYPDLNIGNINNKSYLFKYHLNKNKERIPVEFTSGFYSWKDKQIIYLIIRDITDRIEANKQLEMQNDELEIANQNLTKLVREIEISNKEIKNNYLFLETLINSVPNPIFYKDENFKYLGCNKAFEDFYGIKKQDLIGKTVYDIAPSELANIYHQKDLELIEKKSIQVYDAKVKTALGTEKNIMLYKDMFYKYLGGVAGIVGVIIDITEKKQAENMIKQSEEQYKQIYDSALVGIVRTKGATGEIITANKNFIKILGYDDSKIDDIDKFLEKLNINDFYYLPNKRKEIMQKLKKDGNIENFLIKGKIKNGNLKNSLINAKYYPEHDIIEATIIDVDEIIKYYNKSISDKENKIKSLEYTLKDIENKGLYFDKIIGKSKNTKLIFDLIKDASITDANVLITGESGTGKELVAKAIHNNSNRKDFNFVPVNCGAIPENLIESELFGYEAGAFTGATKKKIGKFEYATGGTLFLDEIAELPINLQVKLLRAVQDKEITRLGGNEPINVDVRIIAATNQNLTALIEKGSFREDLFYRMNVISIHLPPLRERKEDIILLTMHFIDKYNKLYNKQINGITPEFFEYISNNSWKGNIRELENMIERYVVLSKTNVLEFNNDTDTQANDTIIQETSGINLNLSLQENIESYENAIIKKALEKNAGQISKTADTLKITVRTLYNKMKKYDIN